MAGTLKILRRLIGEDIDLAWLPGIGVWPVMIDPGQLDQLLANLCLNARDAIAGVGKVTIETENVLIDRSYCEEHPDFLPGEYVRLGVNDGGCGMDRDTRTHIFEPFFTAGSPGKGTGLGLATVYGIVRQNQGFINVYSEPGRGSTFSIHLPRYRGEPEPVEETGKALPRRGEGELVLLVEDEPSLLEMEQTMLEELGYRVLAAGSPSEAIAAATDHAGRIDLLATDVIMPEMNGRELAERIRERPPGLKELFMSGYTANVIIHRGVLDEGVHYIQKPFTRKDLAAKLRTALGAG